MGRRTKGSKIQILKKSKNWHVGNSNMGQKWGGRKGGRERETVANTWLRMSVKALFERWTNPPCREEGRKGRREGERERWFGTHG